MPRITRLLLAAGLIATPASADQGQSESLLRMAHRESLETLHDRANALDHWKASLAYTEQAYELRRGSSTELQVLAKLAERSFYAEEYTKAESYAARAIALAAEPQATGTFSVGNAIHHGNLVLGKLALLHDDLEAAGEYLLAAGRTPGSPQLNTFGPNMALAESLVKRGERAVVLEYFALCRRFWRSGVERGTLDEWTRVVESGGTPNFGSSVIYGH